MSKASEKRKAAAEKFVNETFNLDITIVAIWSDTSQDIWKIPYDQVSQPFRLLLEMNKFGVINKSDGQFTGDEAMIYGQLYGTTSGWNHLRKRLDDTSDSRIPEDSLFYTFQIAC